jgi:hypothetical protein
MGSVICAKPARIACYCVAGTAPFRSDWIRSAIFLNSNNPLASGENASDWPGGPWNLALFRQSSSAAPAFLSLVSESCCSDLILLGSFRRSWFSDRKRVHLAETTQPQLALGASNWLRFAFFIRRRQRLPARRTRSPTPPLWHDRMLLILVVLRRPTTEVPPAPIPAEATTRRLLHVSYYLGTSLCRSSRREPWYIRKTRTTSRGSSTSNTIRCDS